MFFMMRGMGGHRPRKSTMEMLNEGHARGEMGEDPNITILGAFS